MRGERGEALGLAYRVILAFPPIEGLLGGRELPATFDADAMDGCPRPIYVGRQALAWAPHGAELVGDRDVDPYLAFALGVRSRLNGDGSKRQSVGDRVEGGGRSKYGSLIEYRRRVQPVAASHRSTAGALAARRTCRRPDDGRAGRRRHGDLDAGMTDCTIVWQGRRGRQTEADHPQLADDIF